MHPHHTSQIFSLTLIALLVCGCVNGDAECIPEQRSLLLDLKHGFVDPHDLLVSWKAGSDCCSWGGITCDPISGNVIGLDLSGHYITGSLNKDLFQLKRLERLDLSGNTISGVLPDFPKGCALQCLYLSNTYISGSIPDSIGNLENLTEFKMAKDPFGWGNWDKGLLAGELPLSIVNLTQLVYLDLSRNNISGAIPPSIGNLTQLAHLDISYNSIAGAIPGSVFSLPLLQSLNLSHNHLSDELDVFLNASTSLKVIVLRNNQLCGQIPPSFFHLPSLQTLSLASNNFSGSIELGTNATLRNLYKLSLSNNKLSLGEMNDIYFHSFPNLKCLRLAGCGLTKVPTFLKNLDAIELLDLSNNKIGDDIPRWILSIGKSAIYLNVSYNLFTNIEGSNDLSTSGVSYLDLRSNMLQGSIPLPPPVAHYLDFSNNNFSAIIPLEFFLNLKGARYVSVANNTITGEIPPSICEAAIADLRVLDLSRNLLSGSIPSCLLETTGLYVLNLGGNQLNGTIPDNINKGCSLNSIILSNNHLEGSLPRSLVNCSQLQVLDLANNHIVDSFPFWLGDHAALQVLSLKANMFHGPLGPSKSQEKNCFSLELRILDLSSNYFHGNLSLICFSGRSVMRGNNSLSPLRPLFRYNIIGPSTYYETNIAVIKGQEFQLELILKIFYNVVDFSNNSLEGDIPRVIGELQRLHVLNLSHNSLTGKIPFELGDLTQLESLDLSANNLSGEIPQHLNSLTSLGTLNLSSNNLVGSIPQAPQLSTFPISSFQDNPGLCGIPLSKQCGDARKERPAVTSDRSSSSSSYVIGLALSVGIGYGVGLSVVLVFQNVFIEIWRRLGRWIWSGSICGSCVSECLH